MDRTKLQSLSSHERCGNSGGKAEKLSQSKPVLLCIDWPQSTQILLDAACRGFASRGSDGDGHGGG